MHKIDKSWLCSQNAANNNRIAWFKGNEHQKKEVHLYDIYLVDLNNYHSTIADNINNPGK